MLRPILALTALSVTLLAIVIGGMLAVGPQLPHGDLLATAGWRITMTDTDYRFTTSDLDRDLTIHRSYNIGSSAGMQFAPVGERVMIPHGDGVSLLDLRSGGLVRSPSTSLPRLNNSSWSADGLTFMLIAGDQALNATSPVPAADITVIDALTGTARAISAGVQTARLSPSGAHVLTTQDDGLYIVDLTTDETWLAHALPDGARYLNFIWSTTGDRLAVIVSENLETDLLTIDLATRDLRNLTADITERPTIVAWSPDSERVAVIAGLMAQRVLYIMAHDGSDVQQVAAGNSGPLGQLWGVTWRPDSQTYTIQSGMIGLVDTSQRSAKVHWQSTDGTLTEITDFGDGAQWSADGRYLLYRTSDPSARLGVFDTITGQAIERETRTGIGLVQPTWSDNSPQVVYNDLGRLYRWDIIRNTVDEITPNPYGVIHYALYE